MNTLVTGGGGFIGSHLVEALAAAGHRVRVLLRYNSAGSLGHLAGLPPELMRHVEIVFGDIADPTLTRALVRDCDVVYHLAALIGIPYSYAAPASYVTTNINGTLNMLQACRESPVRRLIITSTSEVYGTGRYLPIDEAHPLQAQSPYAATKIAADKLAEAFYKSFDLPVVTLRPFNTYGPRQSARAVIPTILVQALSGEQEIRLGSLDPKRDLTFVTDTVHAFILAGEAPGIEGEVIHFGQGKTISVGELAQKCLDVVGSSARISTTSERHRPPKSEVEVLLCNPAKARATLGWSPEVGLDDGLRRVADYLRNHLDEYRPATYVV
jgi:NAD dependent epimerase/dehydratase